MKFNRLKIANFLTIKFGEIALDNRGLNIIQGVNDDDTSADSNGAGKSSVVDALCWALFGVTARGAKGDAVVSLAMKKDCMVEVFMEHGKTMYRVARHRKHKEYKNSLTLHARPSDDPGHVAIDLTKGTDAETQKEVEKVLGCSMDVFLAAVYSGQEAMPDLPKMTDRDLKRLIEEAAGLERIERAYEEARIRRNAISSKMDTIEVKRQSCITRIARDEASLELKLREQAAFEEGRVVRVNEAQNKVNETAAALREAAAAGIALSPKAKEAAAQIDVLNETLANFSKLDQAARDAETAATKAEASIGRALLIEARNTVATIQEQIENVDEALAEPCSECGKPHTEDDRHTYLSHRSNRLEDAQKNLKLVEARIREQIADVKKLKELAVAARAAVPDVAAENARRTELQAILDGHAELLRTASVAKGHWEAAKSALAMRESEPNPSTSVVESLRGSIESEAALLAGMTSDHTKLAAELEVADAVVKVFGPAGVRAHILDTVTPFLNDRTADYLSVLSDGAITARWSTLTRSASGDLKEKFSIDVANSKGGDSFSLLSGGEKRKVRLATALALQDLVASRATHPIDLWIGDEVDDALDKAGLERLMVILERRARERGTVLIISHNSLSDWCDNITTVRKSGVWSSVLEGALCV